MIKNDSSTKSATGLTGSGSRDWIVQRFGAVVLALYGIVMLGYFLTHSSVDFYEWSAFMNSLPMKLFSLVAIISLAGHAWVGIWTVLTDYVKSSGLRLLLQALMVAAILVYVFWGIMIFWGSGFGVMAV